MATKPPLPPKPPHLQQRPRGGSGLQPVQHVPPRPTGVILPIARGMIESVAELGSSGMNPIWLVSMKNTQTKLIVKKERQFKDDKHQPVGFLAKGNIKAMNGVMAQASPTAVMAVLETSEIDALGAFLKTPNSMREAISEVRLRGTANLVKMKYDSSFASSSPMSVSMGKFTMSEKDKEDARSLLGALRGNRPAWQTLGAVIVADALLGNQDRVSINTGKVTNFGNLIFSRKPSGEVTHALGFDTIDIESKSGALLYGTNIQTWANEVGNGIKNKWSLPGLANKIIASVNKDRMVPLGLDPFSHAEIAALGEGLVEAWDKQAKRINDMIRNGKGVPSGLMARAKYLGWVK